MTDARKRPWALLFLVSLGLNLFLGGVIATRWMARPRATAADLRPIPVMRMRRALGPEADPAVDRVMSKHRDVLADRSRETRQARQRAFEALSADPYDPAHAAAALADFRSKLGLMQQTMDDVMLELARDLTPQQRKKLRDVMDQPGDRMGPGHGRRHRFGPGRAE